MSNGTNCPKCQKDIGLFAVFRASNPTRIRCPHCQAAIYYAGARILAIVLRILAVLLLAGILYLVHRGFHSDNTNLKFFIAFGIFIPVWAVVELLTALYLRRQKTLEYVELSA